MNTQLIYAHLYIMSLSSNHRKPRFSHNQSWAFVWTQRVVVVVAEQLTAGWLGGWLSVASWLQWISAVMMTRILLTAMVRVGGDQILYSIRTLQGLLRKPGRQWLKVSSGIHHRPVNRVYCIPKVERSDGVQHQDTPRTAQEAWETVTDNIRNIQAQAGAKTVQSVHFSQKTRKSRALHMHILMPTYFGEIFQKFSILIKHHFVANNVYINYMFCWSNI